MNDIIQKYYGKSGLPEYLIKEKVSKFERHPDIENEFAKWIQSGEFIDKDHCVRVEGYTAKSISQKSSYLNGDSAFILLIDLRENKDNALKMLHSKLTMK